MAEYASFKFIYILSFKPPIIFEFLSNASFSIEDKFIIFEINIVN